MTDDRSAFTEAREVGLQRRNETREARAIRRQVAEEIASALEDAGDAKADLHSGMPAPGYYECAGIARTFGSKEIS